MSDGALVTAATEAQARREAAGRAVPVTDGHTGAETRPERGLVDVH
ncbi:hypothetical protein [Paractinoplanes abujensis]|uniref:Uncharacterized protein n=1 Tax=Paractinoplanes abujensis TaxID=882441 RepID=A0A7W7G5E1_9ACTN|nr:hypothetical protein [Actinoplanes abujensis]MBB4696862.1 hypothetical protein [Actinoplanes abujensis]